MENVGLPEACLHSCAGKLIYSNHCLMATYIQLMPVLVQRHIADYEATSSVPVGNPKTKEKPQ
uniref:Uncharacterized protein n=1 Tax=Monodon monoceros TaxID=40151 RepID=A0A8C6F1H1_MONMO